LTQGGVFDKIIGGKQEYAKVILKIEPSKLDKGDVLIQDDIQDGTLPPDIVELIKKTIRNSASSGVLMGYPMTDIKVTLIGGEYDEARSSEMSVSGAVSNAFVEGCRKANPVLLEPIVSIKITTPEECTGDILNSINNRHGKIEQIETKEPFKIISALAPLSKMFGYTTELRSLSQGRAVQSMLLSHFDKVDKQKINKPSH
jgi:elongation factor G